MNFLCHAMPYLDRPVLAVSTGIPDWLSVVDRKIRARGRYAAAHIDSGDEGLRDVAAGILKHIEDDRWFHSTAAFTQLNLQLAVQLRDLLPGDAGFRPTFVGHILIEMLLDAFWIRDDPQHGQDYYDAVASVDLESLQRHVNTITGKPTDRLMPTIERFLEVRFLYDYLDSERLLMRLNQVMKRVRLAQLPDSVLDWLPSASSQVESQRVQMLSPPAGIPAFPLGD